MALPDYSWLYSGNIYVDSETGKDADAGTVQAPKKTANAGAGVLASSQTLVLHGFFNEKLTMATGIYATLIKGDKYATLNGLGLSSKIAFSYDVGQGANYYIVNLTIEYYTYLIQYDLNSPIFYFQNCVLKLNTDFINDIHLTNTYFSMFQKVLLIKNTFIKIRPDSLTVKRSYGETSIGNTTIQIYSIGDSSNLVNQLKIFDKHYDGTLTGIFFMNNTDIGYSVLNSLGCTFKFGQKTPAISNFSSSSGALVMTTDVHGFYNGQRINIGTDCGEAAYRGNWFVLLVSATTFRFSSTLNGSAVAYATAPSVKGTLTNWGESTNVGVDGKCLTFSTYKTIAELKALVTLYSLWSQGTDDDVTFLRKVASYVFTGVSTNSANYFIGCKVVTDCGFVDKANDDYRLLSTSPAVGIGLSGENAGMYGVVTNPLIFPDDYEDASFVNMKVAYCTTKNTSQYLTTTKVKITSIAHGLITGNRIKLLNSTVAAYNGYNSITYIDADNFYLDTKVYSIAGTINYKYWSGEILDSSDAGGIASIRTNIIALTIPERITQFYVNGVFAYRNREVLDASLNVGSQISAGDTFAIDKRYVVEYAPISYGSVPTTYNPGDKFNAVIGYTTFTGTGKIRQYLELTNKQTIKIKSSSGENPTLYGCSFVEFEINKTITTAQYDANGNLTGNAGTAVSLYSKYCQLDYIIQLFEKV